MANEQTLATLHQVEFLHTLQPEVLEKVASIAQVLQFDDGAVIFRQGAPAVNVYLVVRGTVALEICSSGVGCKRILTVGPGELLGWSPVLQQERLTATARALESTECIALDGPQLRALCEHDPQFGYQFMQRAALALAKRLSATRLQLIDVYGTQMPEVADERP